MCRLTKPITYYCDDDQASPPHIYLHPEPEQWEGCLNHHNVDLRGKIFSAPERTCYDAPDQAPLANSICPDCQLEWGTERTAIINAHMKAILQRMDDLCGLFNNPSKLRAEMRSSCHLVFDFAMHIEMPAPDEKYTQYLLPPKDTGPANVARYYCDNLMADHRYEPNQWWDACDQHPNPELRNLRYLETPQEPPCSRSLNPPLPDDICPIYRVRYGDPRSNKMQSHIANLLELVFVAGNYRYLATGARNIREHIFYDVQRYSPYLSPTAPQGEQYTLYGNHPRHPPRPWSMEVEQGLVVPYLFALQDLEGSWIPDEIALELERRHTSVTVMRRLVFQLFRAKIDYQEVWALLHAPRPPEL
ncbi:hypothetical protein BCON_0111g00260 [Botryotinia convoluta]|uniref:Uncharacterized protein n=1 Tax=Botryotinia convoluta TaxID=54673 RepID=A0A4Z1IBJ1_9HELO|nr:hypothetical protein BCON_0111g00260 [Botryotinia convoluta]